MNTNKRIQSIYKLINESKLEIEEIRDTEINKTNARINQNALQITKKINEMLSLVGKT